MDLDDALILFSYWRSSAAYRVRIALNVKGLDYEIRPVHLLRDGGEHRTDAYHKLNPQRLVPTLVHGERVFQQSMAIIEYLDEEFAGPALMPPDTRSRMHARTISQMIACDIHPLNNLRVLSFLDELEVSAMVRKEWYRHWVVEGFTAVEHALERSVATGLFCCGDQPTMADACLIPQVYNARRFDIDLEPYPLIRQIDEQCSQLQAFVDAAPENQPDAERP